MSRISLFFCCLLGWLTMCAQSSYQPLHYDIYHSLDRFEILYGGGTPFHNSLKYYQRSSVIDYARHLDSVDQLSPLDLEDLAFIFKENNEFVDENDERYYQTKKPFLKYFYKTPANFLELGNQDFYVKINPILNLKYGEAKNNGDVIFQNTRGFELRGAIDDKVYFYSSLFENQQRFNDYIEDRIARFDAIPGQGLFKNYNSSVIDDLQGWDFLNAQAYVGFNISKSVGLQFGHGKNFIGNGYHSSLLGEYGHNYFYFKFNTQFWKIHYQNIFAELSSFGSRDLQGNTLIPKKYMAAHYLDFKISNNLSIGLFEAVIFNRLNNFEFQYLNPVILYRTVELFLDSPDNVLIGLNVSWNIKQQFQVYGQLMFDEFKLSEITAGNGWWANKFGTQIGLKYMNVLNIDHLDAQLEFNQARPYLYAHRDTIEGLDDRAIGSYSHYNQPLAHPLGANFREFLFKVRYQPIHKLVIDARIIRTSYGDDPNGQNWGGNILRSFNTREMDFNNSIGQGIETEVTLFGLDLSYQFMHNFYLDLNILIRNQDSALDERDRDTKYFGGGLRVNMSNQRLDY